jgi:hypothetical protein
MFKDWATRGRLARRRRKLAREMRLRFAGNFHSHVEIAGGVLSGCNCRARCYAKRDGSIRQQTLKVIRSAVVVVY